MRKLWAATAAIVVCLALGAVPALAQPEDEAVEVTSTQECAWSSGVGTCTAAASDPRVTGPLIETWTWDVSSPGGARFYVSEFETTLEGPDGTWTGHLYATWDADFATNGLAVLTGDGAYEGWTYVFSGGAPGGSATWDSVGTVYPGSPPPPWEMPAEASE
jgi:hypothetical protein